jgi:hypothetical protein
LERTTNQSGNPPTALRKELMVSSHDTPYSGNAGTRKSIDKMKKHFTWYKMGKDVKIHIQQCPVCISGKQEENQK